MAGLQDLTFNEDRELGFAVDECLDEGKSVAETVAILESRGQFPKKSIWKKSLELFKERQVKKQERFKRFGSVQHLIPGWTKADDFAEQWSKRQRPTPNVSWNLERDGEVHERMMAPLPVSRERILPPMFSTQGDTHQIDPEKSRYEMHSNISPTWKTRPYHQQKRPFHKSHRRHPTYGNSAWVNPDYSISDSASTVTSTSMSSSTLYKIDMHGYDDDDDDDNSEMF